MQLYLADLFAMQHGLQVAHMGGSPLEMDGEERIQFIKDMAYALEDEIHEATGEVGWKPWASSRHVNEEAFLKEMVDGLHFWMNLCMAGAPRGMSFVELAQKLCDMYSEKNQANAQRQIEGYDGVSGKCPNCHRDIKETSYVFVDHNDPGSARMRACPCGKRLGPV